MYCIIVERATYCAVSLTIEALVKTLGPDGDLATGNVMVMESISMKIPTELLSIEKFMNQALPK